jgi:hypothetical protein
MSRPLRATSSQYLCGYFAQQSVVVSTHLLLLRVCRTRQGGPDAGFTQRATIDYEAGEFYVLSGLMKEKNSSTETVKNSFWVYHIKTDKWTRVYQNENVDPDYWNMMGNVEPVPRFAHQLVYDSINKVTESSFEQLPKD